MGQEKLNLKTKEDKIELYCKVRHRRQYWEGTIIKFVPNGKIVVQLSTIGYEWVDNIEELVKIDKFTNKSEKEEVKRVRIKNLDYLG